VPITIRVNPNQLPTVALTAPVAGSIVDLPAKVNLAATASDSDGTIAKVEFYIAGTSRIATVTTAPYTYAWTAPGGSYSLTAKATDDKGGISTSAAVGIVVNAGPSVAILSPANGAMIPGPANVPVGVNAIDSEGTIAKVDLFSGGVLIGTRTAAPYDFTWSGAGPGVYALTAKATDNRGVITTSAAVNVTIVANESPHVEFLYPFDGGGYGGPVASISMSIAAWDTDGTIAKVDVFAGTTRLVTFTEAPYDFTWPDVVTGIYSITAVATDDCGATTSTAPVVVKVVAPIVSVTTPTDNATFVAPATIALGANAYEDGADVIQVQYFANGTAIGYSQAAPWSVSWSNVPVGTYLVTARAYDSWGTVVESAPVRVVVGENQLPAVTLDAPEAGVVFTITGATPVRFRATASDADGTITRVQFILAWGPRQTCWARS
jgi:hypothetical protein